MGLARPAVAQRNDVLPPRDIAAARQLQNQQLVQGRDRSKVKAVQALHTREARLTNAPLNQPPLAVQQLKFPLGDSGIGAKLSSSGSPRLIARCGRTYRGGCGEPGPGL